MAAKLTRPRAELEKLFEETMDSGIKFYGLVDDTAPNRMIGILSQWDKGARTLLRDAFTEAVLWRRRWPGPFREK
jgi:hypothetical protein